MSTSKLKTLLVVIGAMAMQTSGASAQWAYDTPVKPVERPAWLENMVMICESAWANAERTKLKPHIKLMKDAGYVLMNMYPDGFCRLYSPTAGETWPAECHAEVKAMHAAGMKALAGCYPTVGERGPRDILMAHPEWRLRRDDTVPEGPGTGCLASPFGDALVDLLVSRVKEYDIDGYQFDGWYQFTYCRCPGCSQRYKEETGLDVPPFDQASPDYLKFLFWRDEKVFRLMQKLQDELHKVKPDAVLVQWNNNDCAGAYPSYMPESLNCLSDWTNKEWWDSFDTSNMWLIKRLRSSSGDRPAGVQPYMFMRHGIDIQSGVYHGSSCPFEEVRYRMHKVMTLGSIPIIWPGARTGWNDQDSMQVARDYVDFMPYIQGTKSVKYAACLDSYTTLQTMRTNVRETVLQAVEHPRSGMLRALLEEHIPVDVLSEHNITADTLAAYRVLILPNVRVLPERIEKLVRDYVKSGGGLVATFETSLYDQIGEKRKDFALSDLFGATYDSSEAVKACRVDYSGLKHPVIDDPAILNLMGTRGYTTYYGAFARVNEAQDTIAPFVGLDVPMEKVPELATFTPLLLSERGKGRVAYFPAAWDAAYFDAGYPYERMVLANAIRWAAGAKPDIRIDAPKCVIAGHFEKAAAAGRQTIVHLLNDSNSTTGHGSKEDKQFAIREEVVPIPGVRVTFPGVKPSRVTLTPGGTDLVPVQADGGWQVSVPLLGLHAVVAAEYAK